MSEKYLNQSLASLLSICFVCFFSLKICAQDFQLPKNSIKVSVLPIFVGEVNFNYERILSKKISGELALGFVTDNYLMNFLSESNSLATNKILIGPSMGFLVKYYPFIVGDELYIDLEFKYRRYRKRYSQDEIDFIEYNERFIPRVGIGYHHFLDEKLFIDFSGNLGLVFQNTLLFVNETVNQAIKFNFGVGLKFGYVF